MFLTKECDYGLRIIRALSSGEKTTAEDICAVEGVPGQFAYKILKKLERAGYIMSSRGREGGYWLVKSLADITVYDIVTSIDENLFVLDCLKNDRICLRNTPENPCALHAEIERVQEALVLELRRNSIGDVLKGD